MQQTKHNVLRQYQEQCAAEQIKPNAEMLSYLQKQPLPGNLNFGKTYFGTKGFKVVLQFLPELPVVWLDLSASFLPNDNYIALTKALINHPTLTSLDLSGNSFAPQVSTDLLALVRSNQRITSLKVDPHDANYTKIGKQCKINAKLANTTQGSFVCLSCFVGTFAIESAEEELLKALGSGIAEDITRNHFRVIFSSLRDALQANSGYLAFCSGPCLESYTRNQLISGKKLYTTEALHSNIPADLPCLYCASRNQPLPCLYTAVLRWMGRCTETSASKVDVTAESFATLVEFMHQKAEILSLCSVRCVKGIVRSCLGSTGGGLHRLVPSSRDWSLVSTFKWISSQPPPEEDFCVLTENRLAVPGNGRNDMCVAYTLASCLGDHAAEELSPSFMFAVCKRAQKVPVTCWGCDLRAAMAAACTYGCPPQRGTPLDHAVVGRDFVADWQNWASLLEVSALSLRALAHAPIAFYQVDGPADTFDNIRTAIWCLRFSRRAVITGCKWRPGWSQARGGVLPTGAAKGGVGQSFKVIGQKRINDEWHLVLQPTLGSSVGDNGLFYASRSVVNREFRGYGVFIFADATPAPFKSVAPKLAIEEEILGQPQASLFCVRLLSSAFLRRQFPHFKAVASALCVEIPSVVWSTLIRTDQFTGTEQENLALQALLYHYYHSQETQLQFFWYFVASESLKQWFLQLLRAVIHNLGETNVQLHDWQEVFGAESDSGTARPPFREIVGSYPHTGSLLQLSGVPRAAIPFPTKAARPLSPPKPINGTKSPDPSESGTACSTPSLDMQGSGFLTGKSLVTNRSPLANRVASPRKPPTPRGAPNDKRKPRLTRSPRNLGLLGTAPEWEDVILPEHEPWTELEAIQSKARITLEAPDIILIAGSRWVGWNMDQKCQSTRVLPLTQTLFHEMPFQHGFDAAVPSSPDSSLIFIFSGWSWCLWDLLGHTLVTGPHRRADHPFFAALPQPFSEKIDAAFLHPITGTAIFFSGIWWIDYELPAPDGVGDAGVGKIGEFGKQRIAVHYKFATLPASFAQVGVDLSIVNPHRSSPPAVFLFSQQQYVEFDLRDNVVIGGPWFLRAGPFAAVPSLLAPDIAGALRDAQLWLLQQVPLHMLSGMQLLVGTSDIRVTTNLRRPALNRVGSALFMTTNTNIAPAVMDNRYLATVSIPFEGQVAGIVAFSFSRAVQMAYVQIFAETKKDASVEWLIECSQDSYHWKTLTCITQVERYAHGWWSHVLAHKFWRCRATTSTPAIYRIHWYTAQWTQRTVRCDNLCPIAPVQISLQRGVTGATTDSVPPKSVINWAQQPGATDGWIAFDFGFPQVVVASRLLLVNPERQANNTTEWSIQSSADRIIWEQVATVSHSQNWSPMVNWAVPAIPRRYWRYRVVPPLSSAITRSICYVEWYSITLRPFHVLPWLKELRTNGNRLPPPPPLQVSGLATLLPRTADGGVEVLDFEQFSSNVFPANTTGYITIDLGRNPQGFGRVQLFSEVINPIEPPQSALWGIFYRDDDQSRDEWVKVAELTVTAGTYGETTWPFVGNHRFWKLQCLAHPPPVSDEALARLGIIKGENDRRPVQRTIRSLTSLVEASSDAASVNVNVYYTQVLWYIYAGVTVTGNNTAVVDPRSGSLLMSNAAPVTGLCSLDRCKPDDSVQFLFERQHAFVKLRVHTFGSAGAQWAVQYAADGVWNTVATFRQADGWSESIWQPPSAHHLWQISFLGTNGDTDATVQYTAIEWYVNCSQSMIRDPRVKLLKVHSERPPMIDDARKILVEGNEEHVLQFSQPLPDHCIVFKAKGPAHYVGTRLRSSGVCNTKWIIQYSDDNVHWVTIGLHCQDAPESTTLWQLEGGHHFWRYLFHSRDIRAGAATVWYLQIDWLLFSTASKVPISLDEQPVPLIRAGDGEPMPANVGANGFFELAQLRPELYVEWRGPPQAFTMVGFFCSASDTEWTVENSSDGTTWRSNATLKTRAGWTYVSWPYCGNQPHWRLCCRSAEETGTASFQWRWYLTEPGFGHHSLPGLSLSQKVVATESPVPHALGSNPALPPSSPVSPTSPNFTQIEQHYSKQYTFTAAAEEFRRALTLHSNAERRIDLLLTLTDSTHIVPQLQQIIDYLEGQTVVLTKAKIRVLENPRTAVLVEGRSSGPILGCPEKSYVRLHCQWVMNPDYTQDTQITLLLERGTWAVEEAFPQLAAVFAQIPVTNGALLLSTYEWFYAAKDNTQSLPTIQFPGNSWVAEPVLPLRVAPNGKFNVICDVALAELQYDNFLAVVRLFTSRSPITMHFSVPGRLSSRFSLEFGCNLMLPLRASLHCPLPWKWDVTASFGDADPYIKFQMSGPLHWKVDAVTQLAFNLSGRFRYSEARPLPVVFHGPSVDIWEKPFGTENVQILNLTLSVSLLVISAGKQRASDTQRKNVVECTSIAAHGQIRVDQAGIDAECVVQCCLTSSNCCIFGHFDQLLPAQLAGLCRAFAHIEFEEEALPPIVFHDCEFVIGAEAFTVDTIRVRPGLVLRGFLVLFGSAAVAEAWIYPGGCIITGSFPNASHIDLGNLRIYQPEKRSIEIGCDLSRKILTFTGLVSLFDIRQVVDVVVSTENVRSLVTGHFGGCPALGEVQYEILHTGMPHHASDFLVSCVRVEKASVLSGLRQVLATDPALARLHQFGIEPDLVLNDFEVHPFMLSRPGLVIHVSGSLMGSPFDLTTSLGEITYPPSLSAVLWPVTSAILHASGRSVLSLWKRLTEKSANPGNRAGENAHSDTKKLLDDTCCLM